MRPRRWLRNGKGQNSPSESIHNKRPQKVRRNTSSNPPTGKDQLVSSPETKGAIECGAVVVDDQDGCGLADECEDCACAEASAEALHPLLPINAAMGENS